MSANKAIQVLRRLVYSFPEFDAEDEDEQELNGSDTIATLGELWPDIKAAATYSHNNDALLAAFQLGYQIAQRDSKAFNVFQDPDGVALLAKAYLQILTGVPPAD